MLDPSNRRSRRSAYDRLGDHECWPWLGYVGKDGYGQAHHPVTRKHTTAHRIVYEVLTGKELPRRGSGLELHHRCRNRRCVNPAHMALITVEENRWLRDPGKTKGRRKPATHGSLTEYVRYGCRCTACVENHRRYEREKWQAERSRVTPDPEWSPQTLAKIDELADERLSQDAAEHTWRNAARA